MLDNTGRFGRASRLVTARHYQFVFDKPRRSSSALFTVLARPNQMDTGRLGLVVSKKCEKTSVGRNRIKRLIRESFRHHQTQLSGLDIVVLARPGITKRTNSEIFADLHKHWGNVARCKKSSST